MKREKYNINRLRDFIVKAKTQKYLYYMQAEKNVCPEEIIHEKFTYSEEGFTMEDKYCRNLPFSGQEIVRFQNRPIWIMNYYGEKVVRDAVVQSEEVLNVNRLWILMFYQDGGVNGLLMQDIKDDRYIIENEGNYTMFNGKGALLRKHQSIYEITFHGGLVGE